MSTDIALTLRAKKLGLILRDAREATGKSKKEIGEAIGVSSGSISSMESGRRSPTLPELELIAYTLDIPIERFWMDEIKSDDPSMTDELHIEHALSLRNRSIGKILANAREARSVSYKDIREATEITTGRMKKYETGENGVPLPELEVLAHYFNIPIQQFIDPSSKAGKWVTEQRAVMDFLGLPLELQEFVSKPVNRPYLEIAQRLSTLSADQLRAVAEGLLEITI